MINRARNMPPMLKRNALQKESRAWMGGGVSPYHTIPHITLLAHAISRKSAVVSRDTMTTDSFSTDTQGEHVVEKARNTSQKTCFRSPILSCFFA